MRVPCVGLDIVYLFDELKDAGYEGVCRAENLTFGAFFEYFGNKGDDEADTALFDGLQKKLF